jgi:hypothetical protein
MIPAGPFEGTFEGDCAGTIAAGQHLNCTVTNRDIVCHQTYPYFLTITLEYKDFMSRMRKKTSHHYIMKKNVSEKSVSYKHSVRYLNNYSNLADKAVIEERGRRV